MVTTELSLDCSWFLFGVVLVVALILVSTQKVTLKPRLQSWAPPIAQVVFRLQSYSSASSSTMLGLQAWPPWLAIYIFFILMWVFILLQITGVKAPESNPEVELLASSEIWHGRVTLSLISLLCKNEESDRSPSEACTELKRSWIQNPQPRG